MTRKQIARAMKLADRLVEGVGNPEMNRIAVDLKKLLTPPPPMRDILALIPGESIMAKSRELGVSRQTFYNLMDGGTRPSLLVAERIAQVTGIDVEIVKDTW